VDLDAVAAAGTRRSCLLDAHEVVEALCDGTGWQVEYPRDVWRPWRLGELKHTAGRAAPQPPAV
jgi:hypothetical protein